MRTIIVTALTVSAIVLAASAARAVCDDANPVLNVPASTTKVIALPDDGHLDCTTVTVAGTLKFTRNPRNTPVFILATGDIQVLASGIINLAGERGTDSPPKGGQGGPGGFDGGDPGFVGGAPGDGHGPGAGGGGATVTPTDPTSAGSAAYGAPAPYPSALDGAPYGSPLLVPLVGGSGGGGRSGTGGNVGCGGGGGGGAILLSSQTRIAIDGAINASGAYPSCGNFEGSGSGGAIRLVAPKVEGAGVLDVQFDTGSALGPGRIRIDTIDRSNLRLVFHPTSTASLGSFMSPFGVGNLPQLNVVAAAGQAIADDSGPVTITLPFNSPDTQTVTVKATNFTGDVPIDVVVVPSSGPRVRYPAAIAMNGQATAQVVVPVSIPQNITTRIWAWTR